MHAYLLMKIRRLLSKIRRELLKSRHIFKQNQREPFSTLPRIVFNSRLSYFRILPTPIWKVEKSVSDDLLLAT